MCSGRPWSPEVSALLDATLDDVLFQPGLMLAEFADEQTGSAGAACRGIANAAVHNSTASVGDPLSANTPVPGTHVLTPAQLTSPEPGSMPAVPFSEDGQLESCTVLTSATDLSVGALLCRPASGFADSRDSSSDAGLMNLLGEDCEEHAVLDQIRNVLQLGVSAES